MAYTLNFTASQSATLSTLHLVDTSSGGTDGNLTYRRIYLYKTDGTTLVPSGTTTEYINWPIVLSSGIGDTIDISVLTRDYSLTIYVITNSSSPIVGATYTKTAVFTATGNTSYGAYQILQNVAANPNVVNAQNYLSNLFLLNGEIANATLAQTWGSQFNAQAALDRGYQMLTNQSYYF